MALIKSVRGFTPKIGDNCYLAENAAVIGDVVIGNDCSIWFNAVLRGDVNSIRIGDRVNIQDGAVLHTLFRKSIVELGNDVSVGHNVTLHGARVGDCALIGMGATLLDNAVVGEGAIVAAGALVLSNTVIDQKDRPGTKQVAQPIYGPQLPHLRILVQGRRQGRRVSRPFLKGIGGCLKIRFDYQRAMSS